MEQGGDDDAAHHFVELGLILDLIREEIIVILDQLVAQRNLMGFVVVERVGLVTFFENDINVKGQRDSFIERINDALDSLRIGSCPVVHLSNLGSGLRLVIELEIASILCPCQRVSALPETSGSG